MTLPGMLADVTQVRVAGLLEQRDPEILDDSVPEQVNRFEARVSGAAARVVALIGNDPPAGPLRGLATEAITWETASEIEYAEYPEQQTAGDVGRGYHLHQRFLEMLADLTKMVTKLGGVPQDGGVNGTIVNPVPRAQMPQAECYPDPVRDYGRGYRSADRW